MSCEFNLGWEQPRPLILATLITKTGLICFPCSICFFSFPFVLNSHRLSNTSWIEGWDFDRFAFFLFFFFPRDLQWQWSPFSNLPVQLIVLSIPAFRNAYCPHFFESENLGMEKCSEGDLVWNITLWQRVSISDGNEVIRLTDSWRDNDIVTSSLYKVI